MLRPEMPYLQPLKRIGVPWQRHLPSHDAAGEGAVPATSALDRGFERCHSLAEGGLHDGRGSLKALFERQLMALTRKPPAAMLLA